MRSASAFGRLYLRQSIWIRLSNQCRNPHSATRCAPWRQRWYYWSPPSRRGLLHASVGLSSLAFVELSEKKNDETELTGEARMLEASRKELEKEVGTNVHGLRKLRNRVVLFLDVYVWEPFRTGLRFFHLLCIFVPVIVTVPAIWIGSRSKARNNERSGTLWWYWFLVKSMERAGAAFIKLGQWAASRTDIFPTEMCAIMSDMHSNAPAHSLQATKSIIEHAFDGRPFDEIFEEFQVKPLGVGAIAQVYKAKLNSNLATSSDSDLIEPRSKVQEMRKNMDTLIKSIPSRVPSSYIAVKVLHPGVERIVRRDLRIMSAFAKILNAIPTIEWLSLPDEVNQFGEMMKLQLDLRIEAANLTMFRKKFKDRTTAWFPYPFTAFTTRQVLVEEFAQGIPLADFIDNGGGVFQEEIANEGLDAFLKMLLIDNFIHADLHPGNIMVRFYESRRPRLPFSKQEEDNPQNQPDVTEHVMARLKPFAKSKDSAAWKAELQKLDNEGYRPQLIFIDTGLVTELNATNRRNFLDLFKAVAEFDGYKAGHLMCERCRQPEAVLDEEIFSLKMQHLVLGVKSRTLALGNIKIGDVLNDVLSMVRAHHVRMEGDFVNVVISILLLEGIGRTLNPNLDLLSSALPILRELGAQSGGGMLRSGDFSMLKVWVGLEARRFIQASAEDVERCVKYDLLSPNV